MPAGSRTPGDGGRLPAGESPSPNKRGIPTLYRRHVVRRLTAEQGFAFRELKGVTALWVAGNLNGPQPRMFGDNRGAWPIEMGLTQRWSGLTEDNQFTGRDPNEPRAVLLRLWCDDYSTADRLQCAVYATLKARGLIEAALGEWMNIDPDTDLADLSAVILSEASALGIETWTDDDMIRRLDDLIAMARKVEVGGNI